MYHIALNNFDVRNIVKYTDMFCLSYDILRYIYIFPLWFVCNHGNIKGANCVREN